MPQNPNTMATLNYELGKPKQNGERRVTITLSHRGKRKRIPTNISVGKQDLSRSGKIISRKIQKVIDDNIKKYNDRLYDLNIDSLDRGIDWIFNNIMKKTEDIDFFLFANSWIEKSNTKSKKNYVCMLNALKRYTGSSTLSFTDINYHFLNGFKNFLQDHPRAQSLYLTEIKHLFNEATKEYNYEGIKVIPSSPFGRFDIPKYIADTKDRVISEENLSKIFSFQGTRRVGLARDCYILSFCLMGMNSIDLYECKVYENGILSYDRAKTKDRRRDHAHIEIEVPDIIKPLFKKYKGCTRVFDFYTRYTTASNFNKHINNNSPLKFE